MRVRESRSPKFNSHRLPLKMVRRLLRYCCGYTDQDSHTVSTVFTNSASLVRCDGGCETHSALKDARMAGSCFSKCRRNCAAPRTLVREELCKISFTRNKRATCRRSKGSNLCEACQTWMKNMRNWGLLFKEVPRGQGVFSTGGGGVRLWGGVVIFKGKLTWSAGTGVQNRPGGSAPVPELGKSEQCLKISISFKRII